MRKDRSIILTVIFLAIGVAAIDYFTVERYSFYLFYFPPIMCLTWYRGPFYGYLTSLLSGAAWLLAYLHSNAGEPSEVIIWNTVIRFLTFTFIAWITSFMRNREEELTAARERMTELLSHEQYQSRHDPLTNILNSRALRERMTEERLRSKRYSHPLSLMYIDLDNFKEINDLHGHAFGDEFLRSVTSVMKRDIRSIDMIARMGGDEFIIMLPETPSEGAQVCAHRIMDSLKNDITPAATVSIGVVCYTTFPDDIETMIHSADHAMYRAKRAGKNRVFVENPE